MTELPRNFLTIPDNVSSTIMLDCDDVLLAWAKWFRTSFESVYGLKMRSPWPEAYDISGWLPDGHAHKAIDVIRRFNNDPDLFSQLEPMPVQTIRCLMLRDWSILRRSLGRMRFAMCFSSTWVPQSLTC